MRTIAAIYCLFHQFILHAQQGIPPIGMWRDHLPYSSVTGIAEGPGKIYAATPYSIFSVDKSEQLIERFSKTTGLAETGIAAIVYDGPNEKLVIAYANSNIDILSRNDIINIPDIKRFQTTGDKTIFKIYAYHGNYYLSTGLGVIVIDGSRYEIKETWLIGNGGSEVKVNAVATDAGFFYAATDEGLKKAAINVGSLADYNNWQVVNGLTPGSCDNVVNVQDKIVVQKDDSLFVQSATGWDLLYADGWQIVNTSVSEGRIHLSQRNTNGDARITILNADGSLVTSLSHPAFISDPREAVSVDGSVWVADSAKGLIHIDASGSFEAIRPNSPGGIATGQMFADENTLYVASGGVTSNWTRRNNANGIYVFSSGAWTNYNAAVLSQLDSVKDLTAIAIQPGDHSAWAGSFGDGLIQIGANGGVQVYKQNLLGPSVNTPGSYNVAGLATDIENNLWISNYGALQPLVVRKPGGDAVRFMPTVPLSENALANIIIDDLNYKWIIAPNGGGVIVFDHGASIDNIGDDRWKRFTTGSGNGNLPGAEVHAIARDNNGFIWIGTNNGVAVMQCPQEVFNGTSCDAIWPVVQQGNFAGYLFKGEQVNDIAVDGADRKWIATTKGVSLVSATGEEVIYHFTEDNSPLLSNDVNHVAIDGASGEVFFSTAKGICSFRGSATLGSSSKQSVIVFPNPVPPGYSGSIGIRGLPNDAVVKITELGGRLVWQGRALGGQAVWNGRDYKGRKISTGVYLVLVSNDGRIEKKAGKIVFINK